MNEKNIKSIVIDKIGDKTLMTITYDILDTLFSVTLEVKSLYYTYYAYEIRELLTGTITFTKHTVKKVIDNTDYRMNDLLEIIREYNDNIYMRIHSKKSDLVLYID